MRLLRKTILFSDYVFLLLLELIKIIKILLILLRSNDKFYTKKHIYIYIYIYIYIRIYMCIYRVA